MARELAIAEWVERDPVDPFPEWALERPAGFEVWTAGRSPATRRLVDDEPVRSKR